MVVALPCARVLALPSKPVVRALTNNVLGLLSLVHLRRFNYAIFFLPRSLL